MENSARQRISDRALWWAAMGLLVAIGAYFALAPGPWGLAMGTALLAVVVLLNHRRITDSAIQEAKFISLILAFVAGLALILLHVMVGPALRG
jgi:hypothetical protein